MHNSLHENRITAILKYDVDIRTIRPDALYSAEQSEYSPDGVNSSYRLAA